MPPPTVSAQEFVTKWRQSTLKERSAAQEHFIDLCHLVGHPTPAEDDAGQAPQSTTRGRAENCRPTTSHRQTSHCLSRLPSSGVSGPDR